MQYPKAPIREALFDVRIDKLDLGGAANLQKFKSFVEQDYPKTGAKNQFTASIKVGRELQSAETSTPGVFGYIFSNPDNTRLMQVEEGRFTYNVLQPYESWDIHFEEFWRYWQLYVQEFKPNNVLSVSTRFTNSIGLKLPFDFDDYIKCMPPIPECLPQTLQSFFMQIRVPMMATPKSVLITETMEPIKDGVLPFILDIEVSETYSTGMGFDKVRSDFKEMRGIKNTVFENCITDKTRELFA